MEEDFRRDVVLPASDLEAEATGDSGSESTRSQSIESGVTVDGSPGSSSESFGNADARADDCDGWTNEKHNSYLDYLEESFVKQLQRSTSLCQWQAQGKTCRVLSSNVLPAKSYKSTDQFAVLSNGCWQKIHYEKRQTFSNTTADYHVLRSPWINHFTQSGRNNILRTSCADDLVHNQEINSCDVKTVSSGSMRNPEPETECYSCQQSLVGSILEASDQNFVDEETEENSSSSPASKRLRIAAELDTSINDQVLLFGKTHERDIPNIEQNFSENSVFECPQNFALQHSKSPLPSKRKSGCQSKS